MYLHITETASVCPDPLLASRSPSAASPLSPPLQSRGESGISFGLDYGWFHLILPKGRGAMDCVAGSISTKAVLLSCLWVSTGVTLQEFLL